ncbi:hypothetical protein [Amycolatopsis sp. NPDC051903]|uniref:hypothetical protein n=1 Tax=Amycolatopsis sp. NPDC051903 TaxID=3363936 RepID=UPI00378C7B59
MTVRFAGTLPVDEVEEAIYAARFWTKDARNHLFRRAELEDLIHDVVEPQCTRGAPVGA